MLEVSGFERSAANMGARGELKGKNVKNYGERGCHKNRAR